MTDLSKLPLLIEVANRALAVEDRETERKSHEETLRSAYVFNKRSVGHDENKLIARDTPEWAEMMQATKVEYDDVEKAKRAEYNARRRLKTAIRAYRQAELATA